MTDSPASVPEIHVACDGSALRNPHGPGGWCWYASNRYWQAGGVVKASNNQMELLAVAELLESAHIILASRDVVVHVDSRYVIDAATKWVKGWRRNGWKTKDGGAVKNVELVRRVADLLDAHPNFRLVWVRGHNGHPLNEAADRLAREAAQAAGEGQPRISGPGWLPVSAAPLWPPPPGVGAARSGLVDTYRVAGDTSRWGWVGEGGRGGSGVRGFVSHHEAVLYATLRMLRSRPSVLDGGVRLLVPAQTLQVFATPPVSGVGPAERALLQEVAGAARRTAATWQVVADMAPLRID